MLYPVVMRPIGIGVESRELDEGEAMIGLIIGHPCSIDGWHVFATRCCAGPMHDPHPKYFSVPCDEGV
jgi:hypothetical protein